MSYVWFSDALNANFNPVSLWFPVKTSIVSSNLQCQGGMHGIKSPSDLAQWKACLAGRLLYHIQGQMTTLWQLARKIKLHGYWSGRISNDFSIAELLVTSLLGVDLKEIWCTQRLPLLKMILPFAWCLLVEQKKKKQNERNSGTLHLLSWFSAFLLQLSSSRNQNSDGTSCERELASIFKGSDLVGGTHGAPDWKKQVFLIGGQDTKNMHSTKHRQKTVTN